MYYLYGSKPRVPLQLVATFGSEQQLRAYVHWATLSDADGHFRFEQASGARKLRRLELRVATPYGPGSRERRS